MLTMRYQVYEGLRTGSGTTDGIDLRGSADAIFTRRLPCHCRGEPILLLPVLAPGDGRHKLIPQPDLTNKRAHTTSMLQKVAKVLAYRTLHRYCH